MRHYLRAIVFDLDPRSVELLTAQLSLWFAAQLAITDAPISPQPNAFWAIWCALAATCKIVGVITSVARKPPRWSPWLRALGNGLGFVFWIVLCVVFFSLARHGITWGGFAVVACSQGWAIYRVTRRGA